MAEPPSPVPLRGFGPYGALHDRNPADGSVAKLTIGIAAIVNVENDQVTVDPTKQHAEPPDAQAPRRRTYVDEFANVGVCGAAGGEVLKPLDDRRAVAICKALQAALRSWRDSKRHRAIGRAAF